MLNLLHGLYMYMLVHVVTYMYIVHVHVVKYMASTWHIVTYICMACIHVHVHVVMYILSSDKNSFLPE